MNDLVTGAAIPMAIVLLFMGLIMVAGQLSRIATILEAKEKERYDTEHR